MACANCFTGTVHTGTPRGILVALHGYNTYITPPPSPASPKPTSAILFLPDFFSHRLINNKLLADRYAAATGITVYFPDIVRNGGVDPSWMPVFEPLMDTSGTVPWWRKVWLYLQIVPLLPMMVFGGADRSFGEVRRFARAIKGDLAEGAKLGVAGFCWGGFGAVRLCAEEGLDGKGKLVDAVFTGHPSQLKAPGDFVEAVKVAKVPLSVAVAESDPMFNRSKAEEVEAVLRREGVEDGKDGVNYEFKVYEAPHGFCVRLKESDGEDAAAAEQQAVEWFKRYLT
jgi:dienelactone hydrolase